MNWHAWFYWNNFIVLSRFLKGTLITWGTDVVLAGQVRTS